MVGEFCSTTINWVIVSEFHEHTCSTKQKHVTSSEDDSSVGSLRVYPVRMCESSVYRELIYRTHVKLPRYLWQGRAMVKTCATSAWFSSIGGE